MIDGSLWTTLVTTIGTAAAALGGISLTNRSTSRWERGQADRQQREREWAERTQLVRERRSAQAELFKTAGRAKATVMLLGDGFVPDLRERLKDADANAIDVAERAAAFASILTESASKTGVATAAQDLATATAIMVARLRSQIRWEQTATGETPSNGLVTGQISFTDFDARMATLHRALSADTVDQTDLAPLDMDKADVAAPNSLSADQLRRAYWPVLWRRKRRASSS